LLFLFGYLCLLIFIKWGKYYAGAESQALTPGCAPSILITFIGMVLMKYDKEPLPGCETVYMFGGQEGLQKFLVIFAVSLCSRSAAGKTHLFEDADEKK